MKNRNSSIRQFVLIVWLPLLLLLQSCASTELQQAADTAATLLGAKDADVAVLDESTGRVYEVQFGDVNISREFSESDITSVSALAFYNALPAKERETKCYIRMQVNVRGKLIMATYADAELQVADKCIDNASAFFKWNPNQGLDSIRVVVDELFFPDSLLMKIGESVLEQEAVDNAWQRTEILGFKLDTVASIPVMVINANAVRKQSGQRYDVYARNTDQRILFVAQQEKK
jgi:hypothetical protein